MDPSDGGRNASSDDDDSETEGEDYDNPYLALRRAKIARNQARLKELGLLSPPTKAHKKTKPKKKKIKTTTTTQPPMIVRRSKRISQHHHHQQQQEQQEPTTMTRDDGIDDSTNNNTISNKRHRRWESSSGETVAELSSLSSSSLPASSSSSSSSSKKKKSGKTTTTQPSLPAPNSVRSINLDTNLLVMGGKKNNTIGINNSSDDVVGGVVEGSDNNNNDNNNNNNNNNISTTSSSILGTTMNRTGKEYVIYQSFDRAAYQDDRDRLLSSRLSFNKYSGVQEWKNVIFLWINLGSPTTTTKNKNSNNRTSSPGVVINEFLNDGKQITWFGGSRMDEDSPIVQKLIQYGRDNSNDNDNVATTSSTNTTTTTTSSSSSSKIILWCRRYNPTTKSFLPYMCLGRLSYHSHIPDSYPVSFIWNLLDYDDMINSPNKIVKEQFQLCLDSSAAAAAAATTSLK